MMEVGVMNKFLEMKKITFLTAIVFIFSLCFLACNKEEEKLTNLNKVDKESSLSFGEISDIAENFSSDYASFSSDKSYHRFITGFYALSETEKEQILGKLRYEPIDAFLDGLMEQIDKMQTREEVLNFIDKNSRYLKLERRSDGEEYVEFNNYSEHLSHPFFNRDQIIKVGEVYHKYVDDICVKGDDLTQLLKLDTKEQALAAGLEHFIATKETNKVESFDYRWGDLGIVYEEEEIYNPAWCVNDRKVELQYGFPISSFQSYDPVFGYLTHVAVARYARIRAIRKGYPCIWYTHKDDITWNNFLFQYDFKVNGVITQHTWSKPNMYEQNVSNIEFEQLAYTFIANWDSFDCQWTKKRTSATTTEMNGVWLHFDE